MARGRVQLESGYSFSRVGAEQAHSLGELLIRIGLLPRLELRFGLNSFALVETSGTEVSGLEMFRSARSWNFLTVFPAFVLSHPKWRCS